MRSAAFREWLPLTIVLVVCSVFILRFADTGEFSYNGDETEHANSGLYFESLLRDLPLRHPLQYTYSYYGHYPDLGLVHWPPLFYMVEGATFRLFGASALSAHIAIGMFSLFSLCFWFQFLSELHGSFVASLGTLLLGLSPIMLLFEKVVMLEIPAVAFSIAAIYYWQRYLKEEQPRQLYYFALFVSAGLLTKQTVIFLGPLCLITIVGFRKWRLLSTLAMLRALVIILVLVGPFYWLVFRMHLSTVKATVMTTTVKTNPFAFYWNALPGQLGWPLLLVSAFGLATSYVWAKRETVILMLCWILSCYLTFSLIAAKDSRFTIYWVPAFVYFAVGPVAGMKRRVFRLGSGIAVAAVMIRLLLFSWDYQRPYVKGYEAAATRVTQLENSGVILFDGPLPGNFIFYLRRSDPGLRFVVLRKALYVENVVKAYGSVELLHTSFDLLDLMRRDGIKYILVCDHWSLGYPIQHTLRDLLRGDKEHFVPVARFPIQSNMPAWHGRELTLYKNTHARPPADRYIRIKMLTLPHDIWIPLH